MSEPVLDPQLFQLIQKPLHHSGCFDAHHHRTFQRSIKLSYLIPFVEQFPLGELARFRVHHGNRLLLCMDTAYISYTSQTNNSLNDQSDQQGDLAGGNFTKNHLIASNFTLNSVLSNSLVGARRLSLIACLLAR